MYKLYHFLLITTFLIITKTAYSISINKIEICKDLDYKDKWNCSKLITNNESINITGLKKIMVVANINNSSSQNELLIFNFKFEPSKNNNFSIPDTRKTSSNVKKPLPQSKRSKTNCNKCSNSEVIIEISSSPTYRVLIYDTIDQNVNVGNWELEIFNSKYEKLYTHSLKLIKKD